jgi:hypothetical protein
LRKLLGPVLFALMLIIIILPAGAAAAEMELKYELNFDQSYFNYTWNALTVTVQNQQGPDWQGTVEVEWGGRYVKELFVAQGAAATVCFYLPPRSLNNTYFRDYSEEPRINLKDEQQRLVKSEPVRFSDESKKPLHIGVLSAAPEKFNRLTNLVPASAVVPVKSRHLDHDLFMDNFALLIISDPSTLQLKPEQQENLARWAQNGGLLVVGGGRGWQKTKAAVPQDLLPFTPTGTVETENLSPLAGQVNFVDSGSGRFLLTVGSLSSPQGHILLESTAGPLLIAGDYGQGQVIYSALNLEDPPFQHPLNFESFWNYLLSTNRARLFRSVQQREHWGFFQLISALVFGKVDFVFSSPAKLFLGLLFYILLVGPVSYLVLKRRQRWEWSWLTIPALALLFTGVIYAAGSSGRRSELTHYQVNIYDLCQGNQAAVESYSALFIPRRGSLTLNTACPVLAVGKGAVVSGEGGASGEISWPNPPLWSLQRFYTRDMLTLEGPFDLTVSVDETGVTMTINNRSGLDLFDSYARLGSAWYKTGPITAGENKTIALRREQPLGFSKILERYHGDKAAELYPFHQLEGSFFSGWPGSLQWIGFNDTLPYPGPKGDLEQVPLNILLLNRELSQYELAPAFNLREGWLIPQEVGFGGDGQHSSHGCSGPGFERHFYGKGWVDLQYTFPPGVDYCSGTYQLNFLHAGGGGYSEVQVFNHQRQKWQKIDDLRFGGGSPGNGPFILSGLEEIIANDQLLLRISYDGDLYLEADRILSVEGGRLK